MVPRADSIFKDPPPNPSPSTCSSHARLFTKTLKGCANIFIQVSDFLTGSLTRYIKRAFPRFPRFFWHPLATLMDQNTSRQFSVVVLCSKISAIFLQAQAILREGAVRRTTNRGRF